MEIDISKPIAAFLIYVMYQLDMWLTQFNAFIYYHHYTLWGMVLMIIFDIIAATFSINTMYYNALYIFNLTEESDDNDKTKN